VHTKPIPMADWETGYPADYPHTSIRPTKAQRLHNAVRLTASLRESPDANTAPKA
jgi:hypothetical protein